MTSRTIDTHASSDLARELWFRGHVQQLQQKIDDSEAQIGWLKVDHARKMQELQTELDRCRQWCELTGGTTVEERAGEDTDRACKCEATWAYELRHVVAQIRSGQPVSKMVAASTDSINPVELIDKLCRWGQQQRKLKIQQRRRHQRKAHRQREELEREQQRFADLSGAIDEEQANDATKVARDTGSSIHVLLPTCGHQQERVRGLTACGQLLCRSCYDDILKLAIKGRFQLDCHFCRKICHHLAISS